MGRPSLMALLVVSTLATNARATDESPVLHAQALLAESESDVARALELLRQAAKMAPADAEIAFDRARLAFENPTLGRDDDFEAFMASTPESDDARLLRTYILLRRGERDAAERELSAISVELSEGQSLREAMSAPSTPPQRDVRGAVQLGAQYDTNVAVVPDRAAGISGAIDGDAGPTSGSRAYANVEVVWTPLRGKKVVDLSLGLGFSRHLTDTDVLSPYDSATLDATASYTRPGEAWDHFGDLSVLHVRADGVESAFLTEALATIGTQHHVSRDLDVGGYLRGGYRSFEATESRSGPRTELAASLDWRSGMFALGGRMGLQAELGDEREGQRELGPMALAYLQAMRAGASATLAVAYQMRAYSGDVERTDQRVAPQLRVGYDFDDMFGASASYLFINNASQPNFEYRRHLAQLGVEARW